MASGESDLDRQTPSDATDLVFHATANLPRAIFVSRYLTALPSEEQLTRWLHEERERLARARRGA